MGKKGKIVKLAEAQGITPVEFVRREKQKHGTLFNTAVALGVTQNAVAYWDQPTPPATRPVADE